MTLEAPRALVLAMLTVAAPAAAQTRDVTTLPFIPKADVAVTVTRVSPARVTVNQDTHLQIDVINNGPHTTGVYVSLYLDGPNGRMYVTDSEVLYRAGAQIDTMSRYSWFNCRLSSVVRGARVTFLVKVRSEVSGSFPASVSALTTIEDPVPANNAASFTLKVAPYTADLSVAVSGLPNVTTVMRYQELTVTIANNGPDTTRGVRLEVSGNAPLDFDGTAVIEEVTGGSVANVFGNGCSFEYLSSGGRARVRVRLRPRQLGYAKITAWVAGPDVDPFPDNNAGFDVIYVERGSAPVADAGKEVYTTALQRVELDDAWSHDADGDFLSYSWTLTGRPPGSSAVLHDRQAETPWFVPDQRGRFVLSLVVSDGFNESAPTFVGVTVRNTPPVARAGRDQTVSAGSAVALDGGASFDIDADLLRYRWSVRSGPAGSAATFSDPAAVNPLFRLDLPGTYVLDLVVDDGEALSYADPVVISTTGSRPVADAGPDRRVHLTETVLLNGGASWDADGDRLQYSWSFVGLPEGVAAPELENSTSPRPSFQVPAYGTYVVQLAVRDGSQQSLVDTVTLTTDYPLVLACAGADQLVAPGSTVTLDGRCPNTSSLYGLHHIWALTTRPAGSAATLSLEGVIATFVADVPGTYVAQLFVHDGWNVSLADTVTVTTENLPPAANAGPNRSGRVGQVVLLNGVQSFDANGDGLSYRWAMIAQPITKAPYRARTPIANASTAGPSFVPEAPGLYVVQLIVNDGVADSVPDTVIITVHE